MKKMGPEKQVQIIEKNPDNRVPDNQGSTVLDIFTFINIITINDNLFNY